MSTIPQRLALFFTANAGQAQATIGNLEGGFLRFGQAAYRGGQQTGYVNQQMRALGTTFKYMIAGGAIYGTLSMVRQLSEFQQKLGLISAIGSSAGFSLTGRNLGDLKNQLFSASTELITPLGDVTDAVTNYLSTVQAGPNVGRNNIIPSIIAIGKAAKLSQTPVEDMTKALTTMNVAFQRPVTTRNIEDLAAKWYRLISQVPGGISAAPQIVGQLGPLSAQAAFAHVGPGQMLALLSGVLRFGIGPAQAGQGLGYLLKSIATPEAPGTIKSARELFAGLGISNESVRKQGGVATLLKIFEAVRKTGVSGNLLKASKIAQATKDDTSIDPNQIADLGISGAGVNLLGGIFRRQHALRSAVALYAMWTSGQLGKDLDSLGYSMKAVESQQHDYATAWRDFTRQSGLAQAGTALQNLQMQIAQGIAPILNVAATPIPWLQRLSQRHPAETQMATQAAIGLMAALGVNRLFGGPLGKTVLGRIPVLGRLLGGGGFTQAALTAKAAEDFAKNAAARGIQDGSPERPFYVIILGSLTDLGRGKGFAPSPGKGFLDQLKNVPGAVGGASLIQRLGGWRMLGRLGAGAAIGFGLGELQHWLFGSHPKFQAHMINLGRDVTYDPRRHRFAHYDPGSGFSIPIGKSRRESEIWAARQLHTTFQNIQRLEKIAQSPDIQKILKDNNDKLVAAIQGIDGATTIDLTIVQGDKATARKRVHIPPNTPIQRGKAPVAKKKTVRVNTG